MTAQYQQACQFLSTIDADWANLIANVGACTLATELEPELSPYQALVQAVAYQQLHAKAGDAIFTKFKNHFGQAGIGRFPTPAQLIHAHFDDLRACGFSGRKIETIQVIAQAAVTGLVPTREAAESMTNDELIECLVMLKGIGQWTVEMMLMFSFARVDVLPITDFGVVAGYKRLKKLAKPPGPKQMAEISLDFCPHRTVASWYLWRVPK